MPLNKHHEILFNPNQRPKFALIYLMNQSRVTYSEAELVQLIQQQDKAAFEYLYDNYNSALFTLILEIVREHAVANEILQDVFLKIWKQSASYDSRKGRLFTWMINIARNASIDVTRSRQYRNNLQNREIQDGVYAMGNNPVNVDTIGLRKIVHTLDKEYSQLIDLAYFKGFTQEEISKMLDIPLGTIKTRLRKALKDIRQLM